ncbi:acyltransferase domain-containing protein [Streptomyces sp. NPDC054765]
MSIHSSSSGPEGVQTVRHWLISRVAQLSGVAETAVSAEERFSAYGLDSVTLTGLLHEAGELVGKKLPSTLAWRFPTPSNLAEAIVKGERPGGAEPPERRTRGESVEPIAVVGMAGRFPGAESTAELWKILNDGVEAVAEVPADRWLNEEWYDPDPNCAGRTSTRRGGFLGHGIAGFDPLFFKISPAEAVHMDPQQRLMLELAWEALEDAGTVPGHLRDRPAGVYAGVMWSEYAGMLAAQPGVLGAHSAPGGDTSVVPARVSYSLGLRGPSIAVNTACSSSLVALHMARRALLSGECEIALAGGVNLMCSPSSTVAMSRFGAMAPDGRCKAFDAAADGYVRGEGGGVVVLKRLSRAVADGDRIYCTMVGSAVNNDGFSNGLTAPNPVAQEEVVRAACEDAGIDPAEVDFVETHGTGTELGDPIEAGALGAVYGPGRTRPLLLGAVKTNVGHLEAAAGITGFVKTALSLHHRRIPGNLNFHTPSRHIDFDGLRLAVPTGPRPWPGAADSTPMAGVSSFGFGGTNCHVLLSGVHERPRWSGTPYPVVQAQAGPGGVPGHGEDGPVFVYGGQGSQWPGMAAQFMSAPAFARMVRRCDRAFAPYLGGSLAEVLTRGRERLTETAWVQASIFTVQVALTALWESWGLRPAAVVGQSMGEVAAAYVSGALSLEDCVLVLTTRTRLLEQAAGRGTMAVVDQSADALQEHLDSAGDLAVAVVSSPDRTVVSGRSEELVRLRDEVAARGVSFHPIDVDYASHGPQMEPLLADLESELAGLTPGPAHLPLWSTVTGGRIDGSRMDGAYWARNLRERVLFAPVLADLAEAGARLFVDVNPHPVVQQDVQRSTGGQATVLASCVRGESAAEAFARCSAVIEETGAPTPGSAPATLLTVSAKTAQALREAAARMAAHLRNGPADVYDAAFTAGTRRTHHERRVALVTTDASEAARVLDGYSRGEASPALFEGAAGRGPRTVFVFPGQGGQHPSMGTELYRTEPVFRAAAHRCAELVAAENGIDLAPWLTGAEPLDTDSFGTVQPALFTVGVALAALWESWGVRPDAVVGHSMGEVTAAYVSGALSLPDAVRVICRRSAALAGVSGAGRMLLADLNETQARALVQESHGDLEIAALNGPGATVLTGSVEAVREAEAALGEQGVFAKVIAVDAAAHSRHVDPAAADLRSSLAGITPREAAVRFFSTVTGRVQRGALLGASYWARNLREPVRFHQAVTELARPGAACFVELGPHPVLTPAADAVAGPGGGRAIPSLRRDTSEHEALLSALAELHVHGRTLDWDLLPVPCGAMADLPAYPWQRRDYWIGGTPGAPESGVGVPTPAADAGDAAPGEAPGHGTGAELRARVVQGPADEALPLLERHLARLVAPLLGVGPEALPGDLPPTAFGLTSLVAMQWHNVIRADLGVAIPSSLLLRAPDLRSLAGEVLSALSAPDTGGRSASPSEPIDALTEALL